MSPVSTISVQGLGESLSQPVQRPQVLLSFRHTGTNARAPFPGFADRVVDALNELLRRGHRSGRRGIIAKGYGREADGLEYRAFRVSYLYTPFRGGGLPEAPAPSARVHFGVLRPPPLSGRHTPARQDLRSARRRSG